MKPLAVDLWHWALSDADPRSLSTEELTRADRFVFGRDRDRFIAGRAGLRHILAQYIGARPAQVRFSYGQYGKPHVKDVAFNLSHTNDLAVLAVGQNVTLGVDIEVVRPIEMAVANIHFAESEITALHQLPDGEQCNAFYRCWTRKEAYLKAHGTGLSTDLKSFAVSLSTDDPRLLRCESGKSDSWTLKNITTPAGIIGALAIRTEGRAVTVVERGHI